MARSSKPGSRGTPGRPNAHQLQLADTSSGLEQELEDILTLSTLGLAEGLFTSWRFYEGTLTDRSGAYTFALTRASEAKYTGSDGYLATAASGAARYPSAPGGGAMLGMLHEKARTNLLVYSLDASTSWTDTNTTAEDDATVTGMAGGATARKYPFDTAALVETVSPSFATTATNKIAVSVHVRSGSITDGTQTRIVLDQTTDEALVVEWTSNVPAFSSVDASRTYGIEGHVDGWYRIWFVPVADTTSAVVRCQWATAATAEADDYLYGMCHQAEVVPYADSKPSTWIETEGSSATRAKDNYANTTTLSIDAADTGNSAYIEFLDNGADYTSSGADHWYFMFRDSSTGKHFSVVIKSTDAQAFWNYSPEPSSNNAITGTLDSTQIGTMKRIAIRDETDNKAIYYNGSVEGTNGTRDATTNTYDQVWVGDSVFSQPCESLIVRELRFYFRALSNAEMAALTA